ncbi:PAS domain-containing protein [Prosthecobacter sp.]|uniref:PAS domain-containing protein n=1 Tax=Prosthecobacter sp. TaxID=1965333 RepID=UPI002AB95343|nr:PAS domain-containing protein [Prosthecobacter sp.]MDZ4404526.1 PAS domain-containing protein [Prosthecobacter sp.]
MTTAAAIDALDLEVRDEWFRSVFECLNDAVFIHDIVTGTILEVNQRACELYGSVPEELRALSVAALSANTPPYTQDEALYWMRKSIEEGPQLFEWQARALSGRVFWVEVNMRKADILGKERLVVTVRDISKRKHAENELRRSEERFRTVLGNSKDPVYCLSLPSLTYDYISPAVEQVLGFSMEECIAGGIRFIISRIHPEDYQLKRDRLEKLMERDLNGDFQAVLEYRFQHKNQGYRWISDNRSIVRDNEGKPVAIIGNLRDFTARREQEEALQQQAHAALLFHLENTSLALVECDTSSRICRWSPQAEKIFGWKADEVMGNHHSDWDFIHPDDLSRVEATLRRLLDRSEARNTCINRNFSRDGRVIVCEWHNSVLLNEQGEIESILSLASDITVEKKVEEALRAMAEGVDSRSGETFFQSLCLQMARTLEARYAQVAMVLPERDRMVRTLGFCADGKVQGNITYSLVGTPCYNVPSGEICYYDDDVRQHFPDDRMLQEMGVNCYMGMPLHAADGRVIGMIAVFSDHALDHRERLQAMFQLFAVRAAAEMERHQAELALRKSEERYVLAARGSTGGVWDWDIRTGGVYYSPRFRELLGYNQDEFPSLFFAWEQKMHPDDLPLLRAALESHLEKHEVFCVEYRIQVKSGDYRWFEARGQALWDEHGEPYRMAGSALDIHERKLDEQRLLRLNRLYAMSSSINEAIVRIREPQQLYEAAVRIAVEEGNMRMAWIGLHVEATADLKPVACAGEYQGYLEGLVISIREDEPAGCGPAGRAFRDGVHAISNDIESDETFFYRERALQRGFHSCAAFPLKLGGKPVGVLLIYADVADYFQEDEIRVLCALADDLSFALETAAKEQERQRAIEALRENERMISTLMGNLPGAAYRSQIDEKWTLEFISEGCHELTGYEPEAFAGKGEVFFGDLIHPDDRRHVHKAVEDAVAAGNRFEVTYRIRTAEGLVKWIWERGQGIPSEDGRMEYIEGFMTDVTEKRRMESQFLRAQRMESIGTLAGGVAHDLNNVLTPILMSLTILRMKLAQPRDVELLNAMENSANRGADMVKQILSFARGVEGRSLLLRPKDVIQEMEQLIHETFPKSIRCSIACAEEAWNVEGDPTQLHQVLLNLSVNARDAMPEGGELGISAGNVVVDEQFASMHPDAQPGPHVVFEVRDTGMGIPPEVRDRIFDPFFTTKEMGKGTGLGLSTTLGIVKSHHGFIDLTSRVGKGSVFRIYLPAKTAVENPPARPVESPRRLGQGELILVVDDEAAILTATRHTLEAFGYQVATACDGTDAIATFLKSEDKPVAVITDMMMPNMDGPALIQALLKIQPGLPVIGASGLNHQMQAQVNSLGVRHFLRKPYNADALLDALGEVLKQSRMRG